MPGQPGAANPASTTGCPDDGRPVVPWALGGGEYGIRGYIDAYDVNTGERRWRFYTTPAEGEPGNETWLGDSWKTGGAPTWVTGTYDPETDMVFWGTGNPWPDINNAVRAGDNLYSNSVVALDADSGDLRWYFQTSPRDEFDHDSTSEPMIIEEMFEGQMRKMIVQISRNGHVYALDRFNGEFLYAGEYTKVNWAERDESGKPVLKESMYEPADTVVFPGFGADGVSEVLQWSPLESREVTFIGAGNICTKVLALVYYSQLKIKN